MSCWINLLKRMEFKVTPDVVAVYLIATQQGNLLDYFCSLLRSNGETSYRQMRDYNQAISMRTSGFAGSNLAYDDYAVCQCSPAYEPRGGSSEKLLFPRELYKMAGNYLRNRIGTFFNVISDTVTDSTGSLNTYRLKAGFRLPRKIITGLRSYTSINSSINNICMQIKALYASVMPDSVYYGNQYSYSDMIRERRFSSLKWDPPTKLPNQEYNMHNSREAIGAREVRAFNNLVADANVLGNRLNTVLLGGNPKIDSMTLDIRDAFCAAMEVIIYITCLIRNPHGLSALILPAIDTANKLFFANKVNANGTLIYDNDTNEGNEHGRAVCLPFRSLSPAGAICISDYISNHLRSFNCGYINEYQLEDFENILSTLNPNPYGEVLTFLIGEYRYQEGVVNYGKNALKKRLEHGGVSKGDVR